MSNWQPVSRPGYFGKHRDEQFKKWDAEYGAGNWRLAWRAGDNFTDYLGACALYEDSYFEFMKSRRDLVEQLIDEASDVYDSAPTNTASYLDYTKQEDNRTHIQDISIRRCLVRMGLWFKGTEPIQIRFHLPKPGVHQLSLALTPGRVPFHRLDLLEPEPKRAGHETWYDATSVEAFYQFNKYLQIRRP